MKAAVIFQKGGMPQYTEDFPVPVIQHEGQLLLSVKAVAIKHLDKSQASGRHYSSSPQTLTVPGGDGVGVLEDGRRVFALGVTGMMAEKAIVEKDRLVVLPESIDDAIAAALPNAVAGSAMALRFRAGMQSGETVLINGATGFTGRIAVQIAKHYGARKVIATGRNEASLQSLLALGADEIIPLHQLDRIDTPVDVVLDYLWGSSAETILASLKGQGHFTHRTRFVSIGSMGGDVIQLPSEILRSVDLHLTGSGLGSWTKEQMHLLLTEIIPEMLQLAADGKLQVDTVSMELKDIEKLWDMEIPGGKRLVVRI